jgi:hypothetical protein
MNFIRNYPFSAPAVPSPNDINNKIIPLANNIESNSEQYAIEIDLSLFSNQFGIVHCYQIYVRQGKSTDISRVTIFLLTKQR